MKEEFLRTAMLLGGSAVEKLKNCRVAVFGVGGVGGYVAEALARSGVGALDFIDNDIIAASNINRQIIALHSTVGKSKVEVAKERVADINPDCRVRARQVFFSPETQGEFDFAAYDYVVDAIDCVTGKIALVECARAAGVPIISSMGTGNKLDPTKFEVADIYSTAVCPLARVMRRELKKRGVPALKVVYSREEPRAAETQLPPEYASNKPIPASCAFVPSVAGLIIAGEVIKDLTRI